MGTVYLNTVCADRTIGALKNEETKKFIEKYRNIYYLGSLSNEILLFFDAFSKEENTWLRDISSMLSGLGSGKFDTIKKYIGKAPKEEKDVLTAYALGMAVNYTVGYRTKSYTDSILKGETDRARVNAVNVKIDNAFLGGEDIDPSFLEGIASIDAKDLLIIEKMYSQMIQSMRREIIPDGILAECVQRLAKALTQKKSLLPIPRPGKEFVYKKEKDDTVLNTAHARWTDGDGIICNFSLPEMVNYAKNDSVKLLPKLHEAIGRAISSESTEFLFRNFR